MHYFIRVNGAIVEVHPLTKPHRERSTVTVRIVRSGMLLTVEHRDIILHY
ncbi:hypothetical protein PBI_HYPERION_101 [Microbacterium phage Hyperion]|uniref:Uncharacterized protein n=1 Tax=Microbacterium phage Hyperion TaxID=2182354 RepID=A0A2U8UJI6_9CAUD|nr:hypothetical protein HOT27_gp101 [Microbacterium phage Hyperion]AWN03616.1 hypothetical protein PBI_HYPERION_101 [Microbacterium phage Hyperion]